MPGLTGGEGCGVPNAATEEERPSRAEADGARRASDDRELASTGDARAAASKGPKVPYRCSFCGKSQEQVRKLIAGQGVYICDECINLCQEIIEEEMLEAAEGEAVGRQAPEPPPDQVRARPVRHQPGAGQEGPLGRGLQPLQAGQRRPRGRRGRAPEVERPARRADRLRQDAARPDARPGPRRPVLHRRRDVADRGRLRRRGRREHPAAAHPGGRLRRRPGPARDHLHRRDRQDRPQGRQPLDHPRRVGRGRPAGAPEDPRGHRRERPAAGRPQAPPPGLHPDRHDERAVHLRRRVRRPREDRRGAGRAAVDRVRVGRRRSARPTGPRSSSG